eukprot:Hpha_TRINITY_DN26245_c0_g1::TRINITY_DN26245_c0_g1_i1::g.184592::m.184592/K14829/IPI3; pre-rRNA-processing protein IPI3
MEELVLSVSTESEGASVWNPANGLVSFQLTGTKCAPLAAAFARPQRILYTSQPDKAVVTLHYLGKQQPRHKCSAPEKLSSLATDGYHVAAGGVSGKLYVWQVATGAMLRLWDGHFKMITRVAFSPDGATLISSSEDATVKAWDLAEVLDWRRGQQEEYRPRCCFSEHSLGVTDIAVAEAAAESWAVSVSRDRTVRVHDYVSGLQVLVCALPSLPRCVATDDACLSVFAGGQDGRIFQAELYPERTVPPPSAGGGAQLMEALTGGGGSASARGSGGYGAGGALGRHYSGVFEGHQGAVTCVAASADGQTLVSGGEDGTCRVWQVASRQVLRLFSEQKGSISALTFIRVHRELPTEKQSSLLEPFAPLRRYAITGDDDNDYVVPCTREAPPPPKRARAAAAGVAPGEETTAVAQEGGGKEAAPAAVVMPRGKRRREEPAAPAAAPDADDALIDEALPKTKGKSKDALVSRLHSVLLKQRARIRELERGQRKGA